MEVSILGRSHIVSCLCSFSKTDQSLVPRKHVMADLRPYVCLYPDCSAAGQDFQRRRQWVQHVQEAHWQILVCPFGCKDLPIDGIPALNDHMARHHKEHADTLGTESLIQLSEQERPLNSSKACELCNEELDSFKAYARHVGRHQEDVALFALPNRGLDEDSLSEKLSDDENETTPRILETTNDDEEHPPLATELRDEQENSSRMYDCNGEDLMLETLNAQPVVFSTDPGQYTVAPSATPDIQSPIPETTPTRASQRADGEQREDEMRENQPSTMAFGANTTYTQQLQQHIRLQQLQQAQVERMRQAQQAEHNNLRDMPSVSMDPVHIRLQQLQQAQLERMRQNAGYYNLGDMPSVSFGPVPMAPELTAQLKKESAVVTGHMPTCQMQSSAAEHYLGQRMNVRARIPLRPFFSEEDTLLTFYTDRARAPLWSASERARKLELLV